MHEPTINHPALSKLKAMKKNKKGKNFLKVICMYVNSQYVKRKNWKPDFSPSFPIICILNKYSRF